MSSVKCHSCDNEVFSNDEKDHMLCYNCAENYEKEGQKSVLHRQRLWKESQASSTPLPKAAKVIDNIIRLSLKRYCKENGYRTKGRDFWKSDGDYIWCVHVEGGRWSTSWESYFSLAIGVYHRNLGDLAHAELNEKHPQHYSCHITGDFPTNKLRKLEVNVDSWMSFEEQNEIANQLLNYFIDDCEPWLIRNSQSNVASVLDLNLKRK